MGGTGLVLKPVSGLLEFVSRSVGGAGEIIRAFGNEVTRVPKTRIRSPRQFMSTGLATGRLSSVLSPSKFDTYSCLQGRMSTGIWQVPSIVRPQHPKSART